MVRGRIRGLATRAGRWLTLGVGPVAAGVCSAEFAPSQ